MFLFLLLDTAEKILKEIIALLVPNYHAAAIITTVVFVIMALLLVVTSIIGLRFSTVTSGSFLAWELQFAAVVMYYYGDNIPNILHRYEGILNCSYVCQDNSQIAAIFFLGTGLLIQHNIPLLYRNESRASKAKYKQQWWNYSFNMITIFITTDIIYSLITAFTSITTYMSAKLSLSIPFLVVSVIIGWITIFINFRYTQLSIDISKHKNKQRKCDRSHAIVATILAASLPFYLLSDNEQPIDSALRCYPTITNSTLEHETPFEEECDMLNNSILRLFFMAVPAVSMVIAFGIFLFKWCNDSHYDVDYDRVDVNPAAPILPETIHTAPCSVSPQGTMPYGWT